MMSEQIMEIESPKTLPGQDQDFNLIPLLETPQKFDFDHWIDMISSNLDNLEQEMKMNLPLPSKKFLVEMNEDIESSDDLGLGLQPKKLCYSNPSSHSPKSMRLFSDDDDDDDYDYDEDFCERNISTQPETMPRASLSPPTQTFIFLSDDEEEEIQTVLPKIPQDIIEPAQVSVKSDFEPFTESEGSSFGADLLDEESSEEDIDESEIDELEIDEPEIAEPVFQRGSKEKINWNRAPIGPNNKSWLPEFEISAGPQHCTLTPSSDPMDYFFLIFPEDLIKDIMIWTNDQAKIKISNSQRRKQKKIKWRDMKMSEMKAFLGVVLTMTIVRMPNQNAYWNQNSRLFSLQGIRDLFSEQRFADIFGHLSFCVQNNRHARIEAMARYIVTNSQFYYIPSKNLSLDESMIAFNGRCADKVYMPRKPIRHGLKAYVLCESDTGYVVNWALHVRAKKGKVQEDSSKTQQIVMRLMEGLEGEGYCVYMDRYYNTIHLFIELQKLEIGACGTIQLNQLHLDEKSLKLIQDIQPQEILYLQYLNDLILTVWKDVRAVLVLSNFHQQENIEIERRVRKKQRSSEPGDQKEKIVMPKCIFEYNHFMGGVDTLDQLLSYYELHRRSRKWVLKVFYHLLEIAFVNSYIIYAKICQKNNVNPVARLDFRKALIRSLLSEKRNELNIPTTDKKLKRKNEDRGDHEGEEEPRHKFWKDFKETSKNSKCKAKIDVSELVTELCKEDCQLEKIPQQEYKKTTRVRCQVCRTSFKDKKKYISCSSTSYWCSTHGVPVCQVGCYDAHRKGIMGVILQKRIKLN